MKKNTRSIKFVPERPVGWLVRFQNRAEVDLITKAAVACGVTKNVFIARSAELVARRCLGEPISPILVGFSLVTAHREKEESAV